ncbi:MAG: hypothetical protein ACREDR_10310 [Blastocatellia bacterium]
MQIKPREETELQASAPRLYALPDGTYLEVEYGIEATATRQGRILSERVERLVDVRVKSLRKRSAASDSGLPRPEWHKN